VVSRFELNQTVERDGLTRGNLLSSLAASKMTNRSILVDSTPFYDYKIY
jgi:hypothetical protein